jgi:syntaxin 1B/2/3
MSNLSATSNYSNNASPGVPVGSEELRQHAFLQEVGKTNSMLKQLSDSIPRIMELHDQAVSSADASPPTGLEAMTADTQTLNTAIRNSIKYLEADAARSTDQAKSTQVKALKRNFQGLLNQYLTEEKRYRDRCVEQIKRQYRIVYPNASQAEVDEASQQNWGNEGVFQTAVSIYAFECDLA